MPGFGVQSRILFTLHCGAPLATMQSSAAFFPAAMAVVLRGRDEHEARSHRPNEPARAVPAVAGTIRRDHVAQSSLGSYAALTVGRVVEIRLRRHLWLATDQDTHESGFPQRTRASTDAPKTCAICLESLLFGTAIVTACGHCYHTECARKSERSSPTRRQCPDSMELGACVPSWPTFVPLVV